MNDWVEIAGDGRRWNREGDGYGDGEDNESEDGDYVHRGIGKGQGSQLRITMLFFDKDCFVCIAGSDSYY